MNLGGDYIDVRFKTGWTYRYSYRSAGTSAVETMKQLAASGHGLNAYINRHAKKAYEQKLC
jgi:hypothetical protein